MKRLRIFTYILYMMAASVFAEEEHDGAVIQAAISLSPANAQAPLAGKIPPGTFMVVKVEFSNVGDLATPAGEAFVQYAFAEPLHKKPGSQLFQTERVSLPSLKPGQDLILTFKRPHQWPTLYDFIRQDWGLREYQAVIEVNGQEHIVGTLGVTFSAYYYESLQCEKPVELEVPTHPNRKIPVSRKARFQPVGR